MTFSKRNKIVPEQIIQNKNIDEYLTNGLWNAIYHLCQNMCKENSSVPFYININQSLPICQLMRRIWVDFMDLAEDVLDFQFGNASQDSVGKLVIMQLKQFFFKFEWYKKYDLIEFILSCVEDEDEFIDECNKSLVKYNSAYRVVNNLVVQITDDLQIEAIEKSLEDTLSINSVHEHLLTALERYSDRPEPDLRNAIKESISAVESLVCKITNQPKDTLGKALKKIEDSGVHFHTALKEAWIKLYGYASDANGIRHGLEDDPNLNNQDALYFIVSCSAFCSLLIDKAIKANIQL